MNDSNRNITTTTQENQTRTGLEIAVIGMAGRFPGSGNIDEFWDNLKNGVESIAYFTDNELEASGVAADMMDNPAYVRAKGVIADLEYFDALFFDYTATETKLMDPQVRIFHECINDALEDAGYDTEEYKGKIGLYAGASDNLYWQVLSILANTQQALDPFSSFQLRSKDFLTTRISFKFDLRGPSFAVQTACSTSLVAIHLASQGLLSGECSMALAGGATINVPQESGHMYWEGMVKSPDGHCRAFDAQANGFCGGNGAGAVVLKLLEDAINDRDHIHAIIKGSAVNNDGKQKAGYTAPSIKGQMGVIKGALNMAELEPNSIGYIETHGTGTLLGDPIEIESLKKVFKTSKKGICKLGSVKTNVGHLDAAAGVAGFIKTVLILKHRQIPPNLHFNTPNPKIDFENSPFLVNAHTIEWEIGPYPRRAGVSSFGIGGTNAHIVLEEAPPPQKIKNKNERDNQLILLSAKTPTALDKMTRNLHDFLKINLGNGNPLHPDYNIADVAYTLQSGRKPLRHRRMCICSSSQEAITALADFSKLPTYANSPDKHPVVFMFSGLGSQYVNMGHGLYRKEPLFRKEMDRCFEILNRLLDYEIKEILYPSSIPPNPTGENKINEIQIAQVVVFILEYALTRLLMEWGIYPRAMIGYSFGEYTAACIAGVFTLEEALKIIVTRGKLLARVPGGAMLSIPLPKDEITPFLNKDLALAIDNGTACIVAGTQKAIATFEKEMKKKKLMCMPVPHSTALHTPMMSPIIKEFEKTMVTIRLKAPQIPYISNLTGKWIDAHQVVKPAYWSDHLQKTVHFSQGLQELVKKPGTIFIEIGPGRDISTMVKRFIPETSNQKVLNLIRPPQKSIKDDYYLLNKIGYLWLYGLNIHWAAFYSQEKRSRISLPTYPYDKKKIWIDTNLYIVTQNLVSGKTDNVSLRQPGGSFEKPPPGPPQNFLLEDRQPKSAVLNSDAPLMQRWELSSPYIAPQTEEEQSLVKIWERFFGTAPIGIQDDFFELGGDSLKAMNVSAIIQKELNIEIPVPEFFSKQTIAGLLIYIKDNAHPKENYTLQPEEKKDYYPVSSAQRRLYVLQQMGEKNTAYNEPMIVILEGNLKKEKIADTFKQLINRQESMRTFFEILHGEPIQRIVENNSITFNIDYFDINETEPQIKSSIEEKEKKVDEIVNHFIRPFHLKHLPLFRVGLITMDREQFILMVDMHHIIMDGTSQVILIEDFMTLYNGDQLPQLQIQYKDFSRWQNHLVQSGKMKKQEEYWLKEFEHESPQLNLPTDFPRPSFQSFEGNRLEETLSSEEISALRNIAKKQETTLYMVMLAVFNIFLSKLSAQEDIVCGTLIAGRKHADFQRIIGMFVNTVAMRNWVEPQQTFHGFLQEIRSKTLQTYENQDYQFENLVEKVVKNRDTSRNPLFDVMFIFQNYDFPIIETSGLKLKPYERKLTTTKFDLRMDCVDKPGDMPIRMEYCTKLFKAETIKRFFGYIKKIVAGVIEDPNARISDIEILSKEEKEQILYQYNDTSTTYATHKSLQQLFAEQVEQTPHRTAAMGQIYLSYSELNHRSAQLAQLLKEKGVESDTIAALKVNPSLEAIIGIMAILKAGGAYMPMDPELPKERIHYMMKDSGAKLLITTETPPKQDKTKQKQSDWENIETLVIDNLHSPTHQNSQPANIPDQSPTNLEEPANTLAYVIYTSGSTGKPKGVMLDKRNVVNYIKWAIKNYVKEERVNFPLYTSLSFDLTVTSIFTPLLSGNAVVIYEGNRKESLIGKIVEDPRIGVVKLTPSHLKLILELKGNNNELLQSTIKRFILGGEALETNLAEKISAKFNNKIIIYNEYGPTEAAVGCMIYPYSPGIDTRQSVPIGKPADNVKLYILDKNKHPVPLGVSGELYISGSGVARGYLNNPEMTAEKFLATDRHIPTQKRRSQVGVIKTTTNKKILQGSRIPQREVPIEDMYKAPPGHRRQNIYRTGDLGRFIDIDNIEFLGRIDRQMKIRGYRIEPGEIQEKLLEFKKNKPISTGTNPNKTKEIQICRQCLLPANYPGIHFDELGVCNTCREYEKYREKVALYFKTQQDFTERIENIKKTQTGDYDCLLLFSGGKDSTYVLNRLIEMGLKVLTFTFDNGYISAAAFANIKRTTQALNVENIISQAENMNKVFVESLNSQHDVCHGCWNTLNTIGAKIAHEHGINLVISGLSRGQIFEMRLEGLFQQGIFEETEIEEHLGLFRKSFHSKHNKFSKLLGINLTEEVVEQIHFLDFFRYFEVPVKEIREYLIRSGWKQPEDTGFCSSNCLINDVGIYFHQKKEGYHFYAPQTSWDVRLGCIPREQGLRETAFDGSGKQEYVQQVLQEIGYYTPPIKDAVVLDREGEQGDKILTAYLVSDEEILVPEIREYLAGQFPEYMIPSNFVQVEKIPLTPNGKVDSKALLSLGQKLEMGVEYVAPQSGKERTIAGVWKETLNLDDVGIHDNFFDLGGTSMDIIRVNSRIREAFGIDIPIVTMYKYTTIAALAKFWENDIETTADTPQREERAEKLERGKTDKLKRRQMRTRRK